ncbi:hypothetical protein M8C17_21685 [Micromonospora sp. RHAY321]|uniref:hypothetical protein n=1 Tax=Micromonospora sp. RHAY321 TaxID=2944807 RepID=UPI00207C2865|nr:hypothetical protein [Micromonospora sp. RHAY321]MCO1597767.1 hypothetical protein [Micromonospora sp. RHAY321]
MDTSPEPAPDTDPGGKPRPGTNRPVTRAASRSATGRHRDGPAGTTGRTAGTPSGSAPTDRPGTAHRAGSDRATDSPAGAADTTGPTPAGRRRRTVLMLLGLTAVASATGLVLGLLSWAPDPPEAARPLTIAEGERLAAMRVTNLRDLRAGVRVTVGAGAARTELVGWVDWSRALLYLDVGGPGAGAERGLLQRAGPVLVIRPDPAAVPTPAAPPLVPPADRWRLHRPAPDARLVPVLDLLLGLAADRPDPAQALRDSGARWLARDTVAAGPVDVVEAPLPGGTSPATGDRRAGGDADGQARYWLDQDARLHKLVVGLPGVGAVTVTVNRADRPTLRPVDALGGRPGLPRALTDAEQDRLERLPARLRAQGGAALTLTAPTGTDTNLRGAGWLSWTARTAYLAVADLGVPDRRTLLRRDPTGVARADVPATAGGGGTAETPGRPPLTPTGAWRFNRPGTDDLGLLVDAALAAGSSGPRGRAVRIREDVAGGRTVDVVELRTADARLRYWIDRGGSLRRLELHTDPGAWAQLDLSPASVPRLAPVPRPAATARPTGATTR